MLSIEELSNLANQESDLTIEVPLPEVTQPDNLDEKVDDRNDYVFKPELTFNFSTKDYVVELENFIDDINELGFNDPQAALEALQNFFVDFPLPPSDEYNRFKEQLSVGHEEKIEIVRLLSVIRDRYRDYQNQIHYGYDHPHYIVGQLSYITLMSTFIESDEKEEPYFLLNLMRSCYQTNTHKLRTQAGYVTENAKLDLRLVELLNMISQDDVPQERKSGIPKSLFREQPIVSQIKVFYEALLGRHDLLKILEDYYPKYIEENALDSKAVLDEQGYDNYKALFMMRMYLKSSDEEKKAFVESLSFL